MTWKVPFADLRLGEEEKAAVLSVLDSNWLTMGPRVQEFEAAFAQALGGGVEAVAVSNATAALHLALVAAGVGPGDEVVCPSLSFVATASAIRHAGGTPVFTDIRSADDWTMDPADAERRITPRTRAILVMHYGGYPVDMGAVQDIARRHALAVVEDNAHGPLSEWQGRMLGTIGDAGCFSFFGNKNMTTGEGGMIVTPRPEIAGRVRLLRSHGMTSNTYARFRGHAFGYDVVETGYNCRLDEMRAALGLVQLRRLADANARRGVLAAHYRALLGERLPAVRAPFANAGGRLAHHIFPVLLPDGYGDREGLMKRMAGRGVQTSIHYTPIHWLSAYRGGAPDLPVLDGIAPRILTLPLSAALTPEDIGFVVESLDESL